MSQAATTSFSTVLSELYASGFDYLSDNSQTDRAKRWVNQSYQELCSLEAWPFLRTTASGPAPLSLPLFGRMIRVVDTSFSGGNRLLESDEDMVAEFNPVLTLTGTPRYYYMTYDSSGPLLNVYPVSTSTLTVAYSQNPTPLVADADILLVPNQFIDIVVLGAMRRAYIDGTDTANQYNLVKTEWADRVNLMRTQLLPRPTYQMTWDDC